jgi:hypothetical protein
MIVDVDALVSDFDDAATRAGIVDWPCSVTTETLRAPHRPPALPFGMAAVYVFALSTDAGRTAPAGGGAVVKVGRVDPNSGPRFSYQHYNPGAARSSLAKSLVRYRVMWPWLGIDHLDENTVKNWMLRNLDRFHFYVGAGHLEVVAELEVYIRARIGSVFGPVGARKMRG